MSSLLFVHRQEGISEIFFLLCQCDGVFVFDLHTWDRKGAIQEETFFFFFFQKLQDFFFLSFPITRPWRRDDNLVIDCGTQLTDSVRRSCHALWLLRSMRINVTRSQCIGLRLPSSFFDTCSVVVVTVSLSHSSRGLIITSFNSHLCQIKCFRLQVPLVITPSWQCLHHPMMFDYITSFFLLMETERERQRERVSCTTIFPHFSLRYQNKERNKKSKATHSRNGPNQPISWKPFTDRYSFLYVFFFFFFQSQMKIHTFVLHHEMKDPF